MKRFSQLLVFPVLFLTTYPAPSQAVSKKKSVEIKPYTFYFSGRQIIIKSTRQIRHVLVWTAGGNRVVEQKDVHVNEVRLDIPVFQKIFFLMIMLDNGKLYTEKMAVSQ